MEHYGRIFKGKFGVHTLKMCDSSGHETDEKIRRLLQRGDQIHAYAEIEFRGTKKRCLEFIKANQ